MSSKTPHQKSPLVFELITGVLEYTYAPHQLGNNGVEKRYIILRSRLSVEEENIVL